TCSPGQKLSSTFGHSALRITDSANLTDNVYNYSSFDFNVAGFYENFIQGKWCDVLTVETYSSFLQTYQQEQRTVVEQELNLFGNDKAAILEALQLNANIGNRFYQCDFLLDNYATRIRDIVKNNTSERLLIKPILPDPDISFRELIHVYLNQKERRWARLGIDILSGSSLDKRVQNEQAMFLPDYLSKGFDSAAIGNIPLVQKKQFICKASNIQVTQQSFLSPFIAFTIIFFVFVFMGFIREPWSIKALTALDFLLFFSVGLLGMLLLVMWFGTGQTLCRNNYNLLWALPVHAVAAFYINHKGKRTNQYWSLTVIIYAMLLAFWVLIPQELNRDLLPLIILLGWRSWKLFKRSAYASKVSGI
ncbi:MAG TPA: DUF4105 domain-containing protein, partial [Agriterribacter sp.]|nr:DUF4105 domain-containing protein [Agriterribacter sp.]